MSRLGVNIHERHATRFREACKRAEAIAQTAAYRDFVEMTRAKTPWRFTGPEEPTRFLRGIDHH